MPDPQTADALMRAVRDHPDDDLPRLALADLLEEGGGDPDRAALIRTQVDLARLPPDDPARAPLEDCEHALLAAREADWLGDLLADPAGGLHEWEWDRGFLAEVAATPVFLLDRGPALFAAHPVRRWRVLSAQDHLDGDLVAAGGEPWAGRLDAVDLSGWYQAVGELERFLTRSRLDALTDLDLTGRPGLGDLPGVLARAAFRDRLRRLRCGDPGLADRLDPAALARALGRARLAELAVPGTLVTAAGLRALLAAPACQALTALDVGDNPELGPDAWDAFRSAGCRPRALNLSGTPVGGITLEDALGAPALAELRALGLSRCGSAMANVAALSRSRFWRQAEELRMADGTAPERALEPAFASPGPAGLRRLDLSQNYLYDAGVGGLCDAPWAGSLAWLDLSGNYLTDEAARRLAGCGRLTRLRTLHLRYNHPRWLDGDDGYEGLRDAGARALAAAPSLAALRLLSLTGTDVTAGGVDALINGPHWRLAGLGLSRCNLAADAARVLAASPRLARLGWLDLSGNRHLGGDALAPLARSEYLSPMTELDVRGVPAAPAVRAALRERLGRRLGE